jgi:hypothetical protein
MNKIEQTIEQMIDALDTVEWHGGGSCWIVDDKKMNEAIQAGRALLEELKGQEPVAAVHVVRQYDKLAGYYVEILNRDTPTGVYYAYNTTPQPAQPKREWVGLTENEKADVLIGSDGRIMDYDDVVDAVEAKLKEKNTQPAQSKEPLTDEEIAEICIGFYGSGIHHDDYAFARAIEAAHGIGKGEA